MRQGFILCLFLCALSACEKGETLDPGFYACTFTAADSSADHPAHTNFMDLLQAITHDGAPGVLMSVNDPVNGEWSGAAGMADLFNQVPMKPCNISRLGSTVKTFTAATILLLQEEGKLDLDDRIADYLSGEPIERLENADQATIRQCLQHSSGIRNYIASAQFQTASLNDLIRVWRPEDLLAYAYDRPADFAPGSDVRYSNTPYILLGMLIEHIEGMPFYKVFEEKLFTPLGLTSIRFAAEDNVPDGIVRGYVDLYSNLNVIESTYYSGWDYFTADGGLIGNPKDLGRFLRALTNAEVISAASLAEMTTWRAPSEVDDSFFPIQYGLGLFRMETPWGEAWFHSGDAIGYYACMTYFPAEGTSIAWGVNGNYGSIDEATQTRPAMERIFDTVFP
ncbi:MAG: beta-lactamase family protein [Flavobacteriales bacterium]|nr:beta-lactamase family protein [Flavobacteriales bacterium]